jgi:catechol 2,3-dioxygenase-like lactoylglutathione lyase family enzyme
MTLGYRIVGDGERRRLGRMTGNTIQITPFMHVADVAAAMRFFVDVLGFTAVIAGDRYAYVEREGAGIRIQWHDAPAELGTPHGGFAYYIDVRSVAAVQAQIGARLAALPAGSVVGPVDQVYGQQELMIRAPDGNLVVFGEEIAARE